MREKSIIAKILFSLPEASSESPSWAYSATSWPSHKRPRWPFVTFPLRSHPEKIFHNKLIEMISKSRNFELYLPKVEHVGGAARVIALDIGVVGAVAVIRHFPPSFMIEISSVFRLQSDYHITLALSNCRPASQLFNCTKSSVMNVFFFVAKSMEKYFVLVYFFFLRYEGMKSIFFSSNEMK